MIDTRYPYAAGRLQAALSNAAIDLEHGLDPKRVAKSLRATLADVQAELDKQEQPVQ